MAVCIDLPAQLEESLRRDIANLDELAKESLLVDLYRQERITKHQLAGALGINRLAVDKVLNRHKVIEDLPTAEEIHREVAVIDELIKQPE